MWASQVFIFIFVCLFIDSNTHYIMGLYGHKDSIIGRNTLNCSFRYKISLDNILNLHFQPRDIHGYFRATASAARHHYLRWTIELLQFRDGYLSLSSSEINMADISSMSGYTLPNIWWFKNFCVRVDQLVDALSFPYFFYYRGTYSIFGIFNYFLSSQF